VTSVVLNETLTAYLAGLASSRPLWNAKSRALLEVGASLSRTSMEALNFVDRRMRKSTRR